MLRYFSVRWSDLPTEKHAASLDKMKKGYQLLHSTGKNFDRAADVAETAAAGL